MAETLSTLSSTGTEGTPTNGGARYTSIVDWENAQQGTVSAANPAVLECYVGTTVNGGWAANGSLNDSVSIEGWTTTLGVEDQIIIRPAAGQGHDGDYSSGFLLDATGIANYAVNVGAGQNGIALTDFRVMGDYEFGILRSRGNQPFTFDNLFVTSNGFRADVYSGCIRLSGLMTGHVRNCLLYASDTCNGLRSESPSSENYMTIQSCTIVSENKPALSVSSSLRNGPVNCALHGTSTYDSAPTYSLAPADSNAYSESSNPDGGINFQLNLSVTDGVDFIAPSTNNYAPTASGKLDGTGADLSTDFTTDITGATRTVPWTIGAYIVSGPPPVGTKEMYIKDGGIFVKYTPYVKVGGTFQEVDAYVLEGGAWVPVHEK